MLATVILLANLSGGARPCLQVSSVLESRVFPVNARSSVNFVLQPTEPSWPQQNIHRVVTIIF